MTGGLIVKDKYLTKRLLESAGVSTPRGDIASSSDEALRIQSKLAAPVVIKPRFGGQGKNVTVNASTADEIVQGYEDANTDGRGVLVEEYIDGIEFRLIVTPEKCFGAVRRLLPRVAGTDVQRFFSSSRPRTSFAEETPITAC
ncbi:ATP-grasp domain-containing protein [Nesterenkonia pannonica]|uniref:ATP-binding protein n=1 Tax=Nesterenkonia pannonica TaxID=1548602 RepID=UPI0021644328|nr:ATP-grasp domain-containing protein [Nesterenkonia pannonica]